MVLLGLYAAIAPKDVLPSAECPDLAYPDERSCRGQCTQGECQHRLLGASGKEYGCFFCAPKDLSPPRQECDSPTKTESSCTSSCNGICTKSYTRTDGVQCYECIPKDKTECPSGSVSGCSECPSTTICKSVTDSCFICEPITDTGPTCPNGTVSDKSSCESQCGSQGGVCLDENNDGCFECTVINCPSGTFKNECPSSCANGCDITVQQHGVSCFTCKQSCEEFCAGVGLDVSKDYSGYILEQLNGYSCVSGVDIRVQTASRGDCECASVPQMSVDTTKPICKATSCGDVPCGDPVSCPGKENTTVTVTCNWGGWEQTDEFTFRPVLGQ